MKTLSAKPRDIKRKWHIIDASQVTLGRLASATAQLLIGKAKVDYTPHIDGGDFVIVINAGKLKVSGQKLSNKQYYNHSGYPSGLTVRSLSQKLASDPSQIIQRAVKGMLPANKLRAGRLKRLKVYPDGEHQHQAQNPTVYGVTEEEREKPHENQQ